MAERLRVEDSSVQKEGRMEKGTQGGMGDDLRPEYDLSLLLREGVWGKHAARFHRLNRIVFCAQAPEAILSSDQPGTRRCAEQ